MRFVLVLAALLTSTAAHAEVRTVMVLPFIGDGVRDEVVTGLQAIFMEEARKLPGINVPELTARALMMNTECHSDPQCLGKGLARLGATEFVFTEVSRPDKSGFQLRQSLHEAPSGTLIRDSVEVLKGKGEQLENLAFRAAAKLISPEQLRGGVQVEVNVPGASISVDNESIGKSPMPGPYGGLVEGRHKLKVTKEGYGTFEQPFEVTFGEVTSLDVRLTRDAQKEFTRSSAPASRPPPIIAAVVGGVGAGATIGLAGLLGVVGLGALAATSYFAQTITTDAQNGTFFLPQDEPLLRLWQASAASTVVAFIAAGAAFVLGLLVTGGATVGALVFHFTRPLPEQDTTIFVDQSLRKPPKKSRVTTSEEDAPAEEPAPKPKPKKKQKSEDLDEGNLPEGE